MPDDEHAQQLEAAATGMLPSYWAARQGERTAIFSPHGDRTFGDLNANANRLARALRARGVEVDEGIALMCANRPQFAETLAAADRTGLRLTTVNWHLTGPEVGYIVDDCDATAFVADVRFADAAREAAALAPKLRARIAVGGDIEGFERWDDVLSPEPADDIEGPTAGMTMLYTSGTTGRPKGVHRRSNPVAVLAM